MRNLLVAFFFACLAISTQAKQPTETSEPAKPICYLYIFFDGRGEEMKGRHTLQVGDFLYTFDLSPGRQALKFKVGCEPSDLYIDNFPVVPVEFQNQRACLKVAKRRTLKNESGFEAGYSGKDGSAYWAKGLFVGAKEVGIIEPDAIEDLQITPPPVTE